MPLAVFLAIMLIVVVGVVWWIHPLTRNWWDARSSLWWSSRRHL